MKLRTGGKFYHYRFMVRGREYHGSTELSSLRAAETAAAEIRKQIVFGNLGILNRGPAPDLKSFLKESFLPYVQARHEKKPKTLSYYTVGADQLSRSKIGAVSIDEICEEHVSGYIAEHADWSPSGQNQGLRTLRRALRLAYDWRRIQWRSSIRLATGERMRERVLDADEEKLYLAACSEPWRTMAVISVELGLRP
ncbi:MAG: hypothetical protein IT170_18505, partial [Bryobacterales bacterium]|nr:hypothetical protein [Bryobacterales bacterium]